MTISGLFLLMMSVALMVVSVLSDWDCWPFTAVLGAIVALAIPILLSRTRKLNRLLTWVLVSPIIYVFAFGPYVAALNAYTGNPWAEWNNVTSRIIFPGHIYVLNHPAPDANTILAASHVKMKEFSRAWQTFGFNLHSFFGGFAAEIARSNLPCRKNPDEQWVERQDWHCLHFALPTQTPIRR